MMQPEEAPRFPHPMQTLQDCQAFHLWLDEQKGLQNDIFHNMILLTEEVGEVARQLALLRRRTKKMADGAEMDDPAGHLTPAEREALGDELADCLAFLFKIANNAGIDLQESYLAKMAKNIDRQWPSTSSTGKDRSEDDGSIIPSS